MAEEKKLLQANAAPAEGAWLPVDVEQMKALSKQVQDSVLAPVRDGKFLDPATHGLDPAPENQAFLEQAKKDIEAAFTNCAIWAEQNATSVEHPNAVRPNQQESSRMLGDIADVYTRYRHVLEDGMAESMQKTWDAATLARNEHIPAMQRAIEAYKESVDTGPPAPDLRTAFVRFLKSEYRTFLNHPLGGGAEAPAGEAGTGTDTTIGSFLDKNIGILFNPKNTNDNGVPIAPEAVTQAYDNILLTVTNPAIVSQLPPSALLRLREEFLPDITRYKEEKIEDLSTQSASLSPLPTPGTIPGGKGAVLG